MRQLLDNAALFPHGINNIDGVDPTALIVPLYDETRDLHNLACVVE